MGTCPPQPDILECETIEELLQQAVAWWCSGPPKRGQRQFSEATGIKIGSLTHLLKGTRRLDPEDVPGLAGVLEFGALEESVLSAMVRVERSKNNERDRNELAGHRAMLRAHRLGKRDGNFLERWSTAALRELARTEGFEPTADFVASRLRPRISKDEAAEALALLGGARAVIHQGETILSTGMQAASGVAPDWHAQMLEVARQALQLPREQRFFQSYICAVSPETVPLLLDAAARFVHEVAGLCEAERALPRDRVVQVALQIVPLDDPNGGPGRLVDGR